MLTTVHLIQSPWRDRGKKGGLRGCSDRKLCRAACDILRIHRDPSGSRFFSRVCHWLGGRITCQEIGVSSIISGRGLLSAFVPRWEFLLTL